MKSFKDVKRAIKAQWTCNNGQKHELIVDDIKTQAFLAYLYPERKEIIVFFGGYTKYPQPNNVFIFNYDASIRTQLVPPELISTEYKSYEQKVGIEEARNSIRFIQPFLQKTNMAFTLCIGFNYDWFEIRELNLKNGEFGQCFGASRL